MSSEVFKKVQEIIVEQFEKEYDFHFERDMGSAITTVGDIVGQLEKHFCK